MERDPKNLYNNVNKKVKNITGVHSNYEIPINPSLKIETNLLSVAKSVSKILSSLGLN